VNADSGTAPSSSSSSSDESSPSATPSSASIQGAENLRARVMEILATIPDPEMPISITDLGMVERVSISNVAPEAGRDQNATANVEVAIDILPTMIGCPALPMIQDDIERKVCDIYGVDRVRVRFVNEPAWSVDRITEIGRADLKKFGVVVPDCGSGAGEVEFRMSASATSLPISVECPFCGSEQTRLDSPFGPTRCRTIFFCEECQNTFERMKRV